MDLINKIIVRKHKARDRIYMDKTQIDPSMIVKIMA